MRFWAGFDLSNLSRINPVDFLSFPPPQNDKIVKKAGYNGFNIFTRKKTTLSIFKNRLKTKKKSNTLGY